MGHSEEPWTGQKSQRLRTELRLRNRLWPCSLIGVLPTVASVAFPCNRVVLLSLWQSSHTTFKMTREDIRTCRAAQRWDKLVSSSHQESRNIIWHDAGLARESGTRTSKSVCNTTHAALKLISTKRNCWMKVFEDWTNWMHACRSKLYRAPCVLARQNNGKSKATTHPTRPHVILRAQRCDNSISYSVICISALRVFVCSVTHVCALFWDDDSQTRVLCKQQYANRTSESDSCRLILENTSKLCK